MEHPVQKLTWALNWPLNQDIHPATEEKKFLGGKNWLFI